MRRVALALLMLAPVAAAQDFSGTWDITGTDPAFGAYSGVATVTAVAPSGYRVTRLVRVAAPLPDGRTLVFAWTCGAANEQGGLRVDADLRQADFIVEGGGLRRGPQQRVPLRVTGRLAGTTTALAGRMTDGGGVVVVDDAWTKTTRNDPPAPGVERRRDPLSPTLPRNLMFRLFSGNYHTLPAVQPYVGRPEFQAAVHFQQTDTTGREYTRAHPDHLLVVQKVPDAIALLEEDARASAFRWRLHEKATGWDRAMLADHVEPLTGMLGGLETTSRAHIVHGDSALHQGVWVASQAYRYLATNDAEALRAVELGTRALIMMCDAPGQPDAFARAVQDAATAPTNGWARSTALPGIAYIPGGNNDMMHGIEYGFVMAERILPPGHPLLAEIGSRAARLVSNHRLAQKGTHALILGGVAARLGNDPNATSRYRRVMTWSPLERFWLMMGEGVTLMQEINGRSGPHLAHTTFASIRQCGGAQPSWLERSWRSLCEMGVRRAFEGSRVMRPGNLAALAAWGGQIQGAADLARDVLAETPYPRPVGSYRTDHEVTDPTFCLSPYPAMPWKLDWMRDPGRQQALISYPMFEWGESDNLWKEGPFHGYRAGLSTMRWSPQDWLHAYWAARAGGALSASD